MSKADVTTLVTALSAQQADATALSTYYDVVVQDLARYPWMTNASLVPVVQGTSEYTLASAQVKLLAVFYDDRMLDRLELHQIEAFSKNWRDDTGDPIAYVVENEAAKTFRLYPVPDRASKPFIPVFGETFGRDYPTYTAAILHTETRATVPVWLELPIALEVLAREYSRESDHADYDLSILSHQLADLIFAMVQ